MNKAGEFNSPKELPNSEHQWVFAFALITMLITTIPYILGYEMQGEQWRFTGFVFGVEDGNTYIGKMLRGAQGDWLFRTPYTTTNQNGAFIFIPYLLLGKLTAPPSQHEQLVPLYHIFRIAGGILAVYATYDFLTLYLNNSVNRKIGVVLVTFGGGLGWFMVLLGSKNWMGSLPIDFYSPETFGFLGTYGIAHLPWARAFFLWGLRAYLLKGRGNGDDVQPLCGLANLPPGILWLMTGIAQPITGMVIGVVTGYHLVGLMLAQLINKIRFRPTDWESFKRYAIVALKSGLIALPLVLYNALVFNLDPYLRIWVEQSRIPAPHGLHYLAAYGLIAPFVIQGIRVSYRERNDFGVLLTTWVILSPVLLSIPFSLQRRLIEGLWVALVALALVALENSKKPRFKHAFSILVFTFPTSISLLIGGIIAASNPTLPIFRPSNEVEAFEFIYEQGGDGVVVLSTYATGNALPAWAPAFVVIGHRPESAGIKEITPRVDAFYSVLTTEKERLALLQEYSVDFVFWGPAERGIGHWNPSSAKYLELVFENGGYEIFRVKNIP